MPTIPTSLHESYQREEWGIREAIREVVSNALDGEARGKQWGKGQMEVRYSKARRTLTITNKDTQIPPNALLMGVSESRGRSDTIGTFGEGLPMAMLVFARSGAKVHFYNAKEKWTPTIEYVDAYKDRVLVIQTRQMLVERNDFIVEIEDISEEEYEHFCTMFLKLDPRVDKKQCLRTQIDDVDQELLLQEEFKGRIYSRGVFVKEEPNAMFGYNLNLKLNRDRHMVDEYDLRRGMTYLLRTLVNRMGDNILDSLVAKVFAPEHFRAIELDDTYTELYYSSAFGERVAAYFRQHYGEAAVAVDHTEECREVEFVGLTGVVLPLALRQIVDRELGSARDRIADLTSQPVRVYSLSDLNVGERVVYDWACNLLGAVMDLPSSICVVDFHDPKLGGTYNNETGEVHIARTTLSTRSEALKVLVHELAHKAGKDGDARHGDTQIDLLVALIMHLTQQMEARRRGA